MIRRGSNFLRDIEGLLNEALGYPKGMLLLREICKQYKGEVFTVPFMTRFYREYRDGQIRGKFNGDNYGELAQEWGLSERQIRRIVNLKKGIDITQTQRY